MKFLNNVPIPLLKRIITKQHLSTCPVTGTTSKQSATTRCKNDGDKQGKPYSEIPGPPIYPVLGSILDFKNHEASQVKSTHEYYKKYGNIVKQNICGNEVIIYDAREFLKVYRAEGKYPKGVASDFWPFQKYGTEHNTSGLIKEGEQWREIRMKLQPEILSPVVAASYLPALNEVCRQASIAFPSTADIPHTFTARVALDMFTSSILGKSRGVINPATASVEDHQFVIDSTVCMQQAGVLAFSPLETILNKYIKTSEYVKFEVATDSVYRRSRELVEETMQHDAKRDLETAGYSVNSSKIKGSKDSIDEKGDSYLRRLLQANTMTAAEAGSEVAGLLLAAVDTTSNYMNWMMLNLARNPKKQKILAEELKCVLQGGDFNKDMSLPYLNACYRETHRLTPVSTGIYRSLDEDIVLNGYLIPAGIKISFNVEAFQKDPMFFDDPEDFLPERWMSEEVASRKGTDKELIDHQLLKNPFSFGPRMCLGSRLAEMEIKALVARIVQDHEFILAADSPYSKVEEFLFLTPFPAPKFSINPRTA